VIDNTTGTVLETFKRKYQAKAHAFYLGQTTMKTVTNLMTGKEIEIAENTPRACDPSSELLLEHVMMTEQHVDHKGNPITMQDIRLVSGEGKLSKKTIKQAVGIIKRQRKEHDDRLI